MEESKEVRQIPIEDIIPNRFQPRINFDEKALNELAESIKQHGIIQPLVLRPLGDKFEIIAGERRYKAATIAGLSTVPGIVTEMDDNTSAEVALIENVQRKNLSSIEEAKSYKSMLERSNMTQEELAKKMGLSQSTIANKLRLLNLSEPVQNALSQEKISERHARALLAITNADEQAKWLDRIIKERLTVRQLDLAIKDELTENMEQEDDIPKVNINPDVESIINNAVDIAGSAPKINNSSNNILSDNSYVPDEKEQTSKFFNYLEDQEVNMSMTETPKEDTNNSTPSGIFNFTPEFQDAPENEFKPETTGDIETLDGLDTSNKEESTKQEEIKDEPIFNENMINNENAEELLEEPTNETVVENKVEEKPVETITELPVQTEQSIEPVVQEQAVVEKQPETIPVEHSVQTAPVEEQPIIEPAASVESIVPDTEPVVDENPVVETVVQEVAKEEPVVNQPVSNTEVEEFIFDDEDEETPVTDDGIKVEPIPIVKGEGIVDPVEFYDTLEPDFADKIKEFVGLDLKKAINSYRELTQDLNNKGFNVTIDETDLDDKYYIEININKE